VARPVTVLLRRRAAGRRRGHADLAPVLTYGWGVIPARVTIGAVTWTTSLFPKDGGYLVPLRAAERKRARVELGDSPEITLEFADP